MVFFPEYNRLGSNRGYYKKVNDHTKVLLNEIIEGKDLKSDLEKLELELITYFKPKVFWGSKGYEVKEINNFIDIKSIMKQNFNGDVDKMTTLEHMRALQILTKQFKKN